MDLSKIFIEIDHREQENGLVELLSKSEVTTEVKELKVGDYAINKCIIVERKTAEDFVNSLMTGRLFNQCYNMRLKSGNPIVLVEGNPYMTKYKIDRDCIKGALVSISVSWKIPVLFSRCKEDSISQLIMMGKQLLQSKTEISLRVGIKRPAAFRCQQLYILQGLPNIGPKSAVNLLRHFGVVEKVITATKKDLMNVAGIGKKTAQKIREVVANEKFPAKK